MFSVVELNNGVGRIHKIDIFNHKVHILMENNGSLLVLPKQEIDRLVSLGKVRPPDKTEEEKIYNEEYNLGPEDLSILEDDIF